MDASFCLHHVRQCLPALPVSDACREYADPGDRRGVPRSTALPFHLSQIDPPLADRRACRGHRHDLSRRPAVSRGGCRLSQRPLPLAAATPSTPLRSWARVQNGRRLLRSTRFSWADRPSARARLSVASWRLQAPNRSMPVGRCCSGLRLCMGECSRDYSIWRIRMDLGPCRP